MQRARDLRNYEELKRKYEMKSGEKPEKKKERMLTFVPKFSEGKVNSIRTLILFLSLFFVYLFVCLFCL